MPPAIRIATEGLCAIHDLRAGCSAAVQWSSGVLTVTFQLVGSDEDMSLEVLASGNAETTPCAHVQWQNGNSISEGLGAAGSPAKKPLLCADQNKNSFSGSSSVVWAHTHIHTHMVIRVRPECTMFLR